MWVQNTGRGNLCIRRWVQNAINTNNNSRPSSGILKRFGKVSLKDPSILHIIFGKSRDIAQSV